METAMFEIESLDGNNQSIDLGNSINALKGVETVAVDPSLSSVTVTFDPGYATTDSIENAIRNSGYPLRK